LTICTKHYNSTLKQDSKFNDDVAGIIFKTIYHALDWGPSNLSSDLYIGRFLNATDPILDRPKNIYMPSRIIPESPSTHNFVPRNGYKRYFYLLLINLPNAPQEEFEDTKGVISIRK
jgi:hypothetical protein